MAAGMLVVVTLLWGLSFPLMKTWENGTADCPGGPVLGAFTLIALRMLAAVGILGAWQPHLLWAATGRELRIGAQKATRAAVIRAGTRLTASSKRAAAHPKRA